MYQNTVYHVFENLFRIPVKSFQNFVEKIQDNIVRKMANFSDNTSMYFVVFLVYLDIGRGSSDTANLAFTFSGTFSRYFDIKVTQIPCDVNYDPPNGCLQYHTGIDGRFETFNFDGGQHLRNQNYRVCVRQEEGYCCIVWMQCANDAFRLNSATSGDFDKAQIGSNCSEDYIEIEASSQSGGGNIQDRYCGGQLNGVPESTVDAKIKDCTPPFEVSVVTDATDDTIDSGANANTGVCLEYTQEPCGSGFVGPAP